MGIGLVAVAALVHVAVLIPRLAPLARSLPDRFHLVVWTVILTLVTAVAACGLALVLVWRAAHRPGVPVLALFLSSLAAFWGSLLRFLSVEVGESELSANLSFGGVPGFLASVALLVSVAAFVHLSATFPRPLAATDVAPRGRPGFLGRLRIALLRPRVIWAFIGVAMVLLFGLGRLLSLLNGTVDPSQQGSLRPLVLVNVVTAVLLLGVLPLLGIALGLRNLGTGYRVADGSGRRGVLWLAAGYSVAGWMVLAPMGTLVLVAVLDVDVPDPMVLAGGVLLVLAPTVVVLTTAVAVFFAGAVDPGLVLRKSTVYGAMGVVGFLLFAGLENVLSEWVESRAGLPGGVGAMAAGSLAAAVMVPVRAAMNRITRGVASEEEAAEPGPGG